MEANLKFLKILFLIGSVILVGIGYFRPEELLVYVGSSLLGISLGIQLGKWVNLFFSRGEKTR